MLLACAPRLGLSVRVSSTSVIRALLWACNQGMSCIPRFTQIPNGVDEEQGAAVAAATPGPKGLGSSLPLPAGASVALVDTRRGAEDSSALSGSAAVAREKPVVIGALSKSACSPRRGRRAEDQEARQPLLATEAQPNTTRP
jgi:hypothetical protein